MTPGPVVDFAERRYRSLIGKRCTLTLKDGRVVTGKVLRGIWWPTDKPRFRLRARETYYLVMSDALLLRPAPKVPIKKRRAA